MSSSFRIFDTNLEEIVKIVLSSVVGTLNQISVTGTLTRTIALAAPSPAPTPGSYTNTSLTVDGFGRITAASSGSSLVTSIANTAAASNGLIVGGPTGSVTVKGIAASTGISVSNDANNDTISNTGVLTVTGTANQVSSTGGQNPTIALAAPSPAPTPGSYTNSSITVDGFGRVTAAANGNSTISVYGSGGLISAPKIWCGSVSSTAISGVYSVDISSAGFSTIVSVSLGVNNGNTPLGYNSNFASIQVSNTTTISGLVVRGQASGTGVNTLVVETNVRTVYCTVIGT